MLLKLNIFPYYNNKQSSIIIAYTAVAKKHYFFFYIIMSKNLHKLGFEPKTSLALKSQLEQTFSTLERAFNSQIYAFKCTYVLFQLFQLLRFFRVQCVRCMVIFFCLRTTYRTHTQQYTNRLWFNSAQFSLLTQGCFCLGES